jgi:NAD(P)-dependent dehydrogenase (short-subunit alcohol dehydrogenase family)
MIEVTQSDQLNIFTNLDRPLAVIASSTCTDGYELAKQFAEHGYDLIIAAVNPSVVEEAEDFKDYGIDAVSFQVDLSTSLGVEQLYRKIVATGRPVEAIVINAGISNNLKNETILAFKVLKDMANVGRGNILLAGKNSDNNCVSKAYEAIVTRAKGTGINVVGLQPGNTEISFLKKTH